MLTNRQVKLLLLLALLLFIWSNIHELIHYASIISFGGSAEISWGVPFTTKCVECSFTSEQMFLSAVMPYIADIAVMLLYLIKRKRILFWLFNVAFLDVVANYAAIFFYLKYGAPNDFVVIASTDYVFAGVIIVFIALLMWVFVNYNKIKGIFKVFPK